jgi:large subunit ribosomal protein L23
MNILIKRPIITEKTMLQAQIGMYTFEVSKQATKPEIAKVVQEMFKVDVVKVRTFNVKGHVKFQRKVRRSYQLPTIKKAIVTVKKGQTIALFETPKESDLEDVVVTRGEGEPVVIKEKKNLLRGTKVKVEKGAPGAAQTTQRKVITGK